MHGSSVIDMAGKFLRQERQHALQRRLQLLQQQVCIDAISLSLNNDSVILILSLLVKISCWNFLLLI